MKQLRETNGEGMGTEGREGHEEDRMHPLFKRADTLSSIVIGAAIEVHRELGPGLLESIYERCLVHELSLNRITSAAQKSVRLAYKGLILEETLRCDILVENCVLIEAKAVDRLLPIHKAQLLSYMTLLDVPIGLLLNFHELTLKDGISRLVLGAKYPLLSSRPSRPSVPSALN